MRDTAFLVGLGLVGAGCWLYSRPVALVVVGGLLMVFVLLDVFFGASRKGAK